MLPLRAYEQSASRILPITRKLFIRPTAFLLAGVIASKAARQANLIAYLLNPV